MPTSPAAPSRAPAPGAADHPISAERRATQRNLISVFWAMVLGNLLIVAFIYRLGTQHEAANTFEELQVIAEHQAHTVERWRFDKLDNADDMQDIGYGSGPLNAVLRGQPTAEQSDRALGALHRQAIAHDDSEVMLLSARGVPLLSTADQLNVHPDTAQQLQAIALTRSSRMLGVYRDPQGRATSDIVTPIFDDRTFLIGFLISKVDLAESLQGFLKQWFGKTETGRALLLIRVDSTPLYLAPGPRDSAEFRPLPAGDEVLQRAAHSKAAETFEGSAEGRSMLVASRPIGDTGWTVLARMDTDESLRDARHQVLYLAAGSLLLIALCGFTVMRLWRLQNARELARWKEEELRKEERQRLEDRLTEAQRFGKMGSWERDVASGEIWWSAGMAALFQIDPAQVPRTASEALPLIHPDDRERFVKATNATLAADQRGTLEFRIVDAAGQVHHLHHQWHQVNDADGKPLKLIGTTQDISERVRNETALREQLDMLTTLIENVPGGVTLFDRDLRLRFHNRQYQTLLDFPDDLFKDPAPSFETFVRYNAWRGEYGPGDPEKLTATLMEHAADPVAHVFERERPDGTSIEVRGAPLKGGGFVTIYTDITDRKRAEERQQLSEKIIATSPTAILITNAQNNIVFVNPAFSAITGFESAEVEGRNPRLLSSGRHDAGFYREFWQALNRDGHWSGEIWDRRKDGSVYPKWLSVYTLRNAAGRLTNYVAMFTDITERKQAEQRIHHLAHHDPLTGLANRMALEMKLDQSIADATRYDRKVAVLFIDLDRFKMVNDTLGHAVGDLMLMEIAGRLTERLRGSDIVARLGGDEFVVVLPELPDAQNAALVAQALLEDLAQPIKAPTTELHTSGSIGIAIFPDDGNSVESLMRCADTAMYEAKSSGRNAFRFFTREMTDSANHRMQLETDLRSALIKEQFELHYQPQVTPADGRIVGVEALLRWRHPTSGMVGPDRFVPVAEETGMIVEIGAWVLQEGCRQARAWIDAGFTIRMSINLSARQLRSDNLLPLIRDTLAEFRLPAGALELEITESALMERPEQAVDILRAISEMGVELALDDFGTGYSSLAYLKRFPIDRLKIDRSFVRDIETDPNDRAIALSTIALAHSLGLAVTAEGVEEAAQRDFLREHGCNDAQGWFYSKAVPAAAAEQLLRKGCLP